MMKICLRYTKSRDEAAALYNKGMLKIFTTIHSYRDEGKLLQWVKTIIINTCIDDVRIRPPLMHALQEDYDDALYIEAEPLGNISAKEILALVQELPDNLRIVFNLFAVEGYSHEEIAGMLAIPEGTSKWYVSEARKLLKLKLEKYSAPVKSLAK